MLIIRASGLLRLRAPGGHCGAPPARLGSIPAPEAATGTWMGVGLAGSQTQLRTLPDDEHLICSKPGSTYSILNMTGTITLSIIEQTSGADYQKIKNVTDIRDPKVIFSRLHQIIPGALTAMSIIFMFTGLVLLFATLMDQEGYVQIFVWMTFANVLFGFIIAFAVGAECTLKDVCTLSAMDWLTGAIVLVACVGYLFVWLYFIIVANSYVLQVSP